MTDTRARGALALPRADEGLQRRFAASPPFPHLVVDDALTAAAGQVAREFPAPDWEGWRRHRDDYQPTKLACSDISVIPPQLASLIQELNGPRFLTFLEQVTGIPKLVPDPHLEGGGLHMSGPGGVLTPHTDFHVYARLDLYRRVNVLLYLNDDWTAHDGGSLELFADGAESPTVSVVPVYGRMVIFRTDDGSTHGFTQPVADGRWRRSIALYYYTATETDRFAGDTNTYWKRHGDAFGGTRRIRFAAYRALLAGSRALSFLAHRCNPNLGRRVRSR